MTPPTDAEIIERSRRRPDEFAALFDRHAPHIRRYLARRLGDQVAGVRGAVAVPTAVRTQGRARRAPGGGGAGVGGLAGA
ncbi:hypothetical protein ACFXGA_31985, partial [Actinosynnema sp. NPDC059335]